MAWKARFRGLGRLMRSAGQNVKRRLAPSVGAADGVRLDHRHWLLVAAVAALAVIAQAMLPSSASVFGGDGSHRVVRLQLPDSARTPIADLPDSRLALIDGSYVALGEASQWVSARVADGETLTQVFARHGFSTAQCLALLGKTRHRDSLVRLLPGERIGLRRAANGRLAGVQFDDDQGGRQQIDVSADGSLNERAIGGPVETRIRMAAGSIEGSLFGAADAAGINDATVLAMAKVFAYDIDFAQDLRVGDRFSLVYEERYRDGERISGGDILAASFVNRGKRYDALRFTVPGSDRAEYYDSQGRILRKAFIRTPVAFTRISSRFSGGRKHPILGRIRAHQGVDYAAPSGTPVIAAADGRIASAGRQGGYGNAVVIDHGRGQSTLYGHLSRFAKASRRGARVSQGTVIGYVGMTGLATGPHLHYEFRLNGVHRDPLKVTMPPPQPLLARLMPAFRQATQSYSDQLSLAESRFAHLAAR
ncbi:MAG: peptidoglycan DD-metalloendopeptidase family protein [Lysobacterales bacterium]